MKKETKLLVHVSKSDRELDEWKKSIVALNGLYLAAKVIMPDVPTNNPLKIVDAVNTFLLDSVLNKRTAPSKAAELNGYQPEYEQMMKYNAELNKTFLRYSNQVEFKGGKFIEADTFKAEWDERHSCYLYKPKEIALYKQVEKLIETWEATASLAGLNDLTHKRWRLCSAFNLVTMDEITQLTPNWREIKEKYSGFHL